MAKVDWPAETVRQLIEIRAYIARFDPDAAERLAQRLFDLGESLAVFPSRGRPIDDGVRELVTVPPYVLRYRVAGERVTIIDVRHGARRR